MSRNIRSDQFLLLAGMLLVLGGCGPSSAVPSAPGLVPVLADTPPPLPSAHGDTEESLFPDPVERTYVRLYSLQHLIEVHRDRTHAIPASLEELLPLERDRETLARDAWGAWIAFRGLGGDYEQRSVGPDGTAHTTDDLVATSTSVMPVFPRSPEHTTRVVLRSIQRLVTLYHQRRSVLPERLEDLAEEGLAPYLGIRDGWEREIIYMRSGGDFELRSPGADGKLQTDDDIVLRGLHPLLRKVQ